MIDFVAPVNPLSPEAQNVLDTWLSRKKNVLLYGPPGTGKTHIMQELWQFLKQKPVGNILLVDPTQPIETAFSTETKSAFAEPIRCDWVTFHQNFGYEQFILALRPVPSADGKGIELKPRAGVLLDAAISLHTGEFKTAFLFIDEVNRGNVSRIFGEFITFMDDDYRVHADGNSLQALPVPLGMVQCQNKETEPIERMNGNEANLPIPWYFPHNLYVIASMNSVDRAVAPLDTALARRFARIELPPDMKLLAQKLQIENSDSLVRPASQDDQAQSDEDMEVDPDMATSGDVASPSSSLRNPDEVGYSLLYRLNYVLAATHGADFEIGHTYLFSLAAATDENDKWLALARVWDQFLYPQIRERYSNRPEILSSILRVNESKLLPFRKKPDGELPANIVVRPVLDMPSLEALFKSGNEEKVKSILRSLAGL